MLLCRLTRIQGRFGWKAMPLAREDLDSNCAGLASVLLAIRVEWCAYLGEHRR